MFERMDPKTLMMWLIFAAAVYFLLPYDLLPDFLGLPGRIDDVLMMGWLAWFYRKHLRQTLAAGAEPGQAGGSAGAELREEDSRPLDAYEVLGVERSASRDVIRAAYWARMNEYHPDKVAHLGEELQELAHEKSQEIQHAYRQLCR